MYLNYPREQFDGSFIVGEVHTHFDDLA